MLCAKQESNGISSSTNSPQYKCNKCDAVVKDVYNHNYHTHQAKIIPCPVCGKMSKGKGNLNMHLKKHYAQPTQCDVCDKFVMNIDNHKNFTHFKTKDWQCSICNGKYKSKYVLNQHIRNHGAEAVKCNICDLMVSNIYGHKAGAHGEVKLFKCTKCDKTIQNKGDFKKHMARVHDATPVKCDICNVMVKSLYGHSIRVHREKQHTCNICDKKIATKWHLEQHLKTHLIKKEQKFFHDSSNLANLKKEGLGKREEVKIECNICLQKLGVLYMKLHMKNIHSDLRQPHLMWPF